MRKYLEKIYRKWNLKQVIRSIGPTFGANIYNQVTVVATQLLIIPLLIRCWGMTGFGTWVALSAIPMYLTISDLGFSYSAKSDMAVRAARGDIDGAARTMSSILLLCVASLTIFSLLYIFLTLVVDWKVALNLSGISGYEIKVILLLGLIQVVSYQISMLLGAIVRAAGRPAAEVSLGASLRLLETVALAVSALLSHSIMLAAAMWAMTRLFSTLIVTIIVFIKFPDLRPRWAYVDLGRVRELLAPSFSFMVLPLGNALVLQGASIVLSVTQGAVVVATFATLRTVTRLGVSGANMLNFTFVPQYSYSVGAGRKDTFRHLLKAHSVLLVVGCFVYLAIMGLFGRYFVALLSHHMAFFSTTALWLMCVAAMAEMLWGLALSIGTSVNRVFAITAAFLVFAVVSMIAAFPLSRHFGISGIAVEIMAVHVLMLLYCTHWMIQIRVWKTIF